MNKATNNVFKTCAAAFLLMPLAALHAADAPKSVMEIPDILLIMPDQMRGDCLSILGHPVVHTPQLDALARQGMLFRRAYSTVPSCIPARYALLTGMLPQTSGIVGFAARPITTPTLPTLLADAGYSTVLVGRNMHQLPESGTCGYQKQILGSTYVKDDEYDRFLKKAAPETGGILKFVYDLGVTLNGWQAKPWPLADNLHPTAWIVSQSRKIIVEMPAGQPLFLTTSFYAPHPPLFPPKKYFDACLKANLPKPAHGDWVDWAKLPSADDSPDKQAARVRLDGETLRRAQAGYFGSIEHVDEQIGPLIADFKARSERAGRPWVIVFTSDHGEMLGDNGYFRKCEPYEGAANIPFIIAASPALGIKPGGRCAQPVGLEDILPTLVELAHVKPPKSADGLDLGPVLRGESKLPRDWLHLEHAPTYSKAQAFHALTDGHYKYIWRPQDGTEQLFDLDRDPHEEHDLSAAATTSVTLLQWRDRLVRRLAARPEGFSDGQRLIPGRPYPAVQKARP
jgi:arylsulfatase